MKVPDLSTASDAGVHDWTGAPEPLKTAAAAAKLKFCSLDLHGIDNKTALLETLGKSLKLPEHFGNNWDALADCLEDSDWLGAHGIAIVLRHRAAYRERTPPTGNPFRYPERDRRIRRERHKPTWVFHQLAPIQRRHIRSGRFRCRCGFPYRRWFWCTPDLRSCCWSAPTFRLLAVGNRQPGTGRDACRNRPARVARGDRDRCRPLWRRLRLEPLQCLRDLSTVALSLSRGNDAQYRARILGRGVRAGARHPESARASDSRMAALDGSRTQVLFVVESGGD